MSVLRQWLRQRRYYASSLASAKQIHLRLPVAPAKLVICTVAFNNPRVIDYQIRLLRRYLQDAYAHIVADNSSSEEQKSLIRECCARHGTAWIELPRNPHPSGSLSHASALNWLARNLIGASGAPYYGFLDHDIYPIHAERVIQRLQRQGVYGLLQQREGYWYLWPGLCFFAREAVAPAQLDFMPGTLGAQGVDTGGMNWKAVYSRIDRSALEFPQQRYENIRPGNVPQSDQVEHIGNWLHSFNASGWMRVEPKDDALEAYLRPFLEG